MKAIEPLLDTPPMHVFELPHDLVDVELSRLVHVAGIPVCALGTELRTWLEDNGVEFVTGQRPCKTATAYNHAAVYSIGIRSDDHAVLFKMTWLDR